MNSEKRVSGEKERKKKVLAALPLISKIRRKKLLFFGLPRRYYLKICTLSYTREAKWEFEYDQSIHSIILNETTYSCINGNPSFSSHSRFIPFLKFPRKRLDFWIRVPLSILREDSSWGISKHFSKIPCPLPSLGRGFVTPATRLALNPDLRIRKETVFTRLSLANLKIPWIVYWCYFLICDFFLFGLIILCRLDPVLLLSMGALDEGYLNLELEFGMKNGCIELAFEHQPETLAIQDAVKLLLEGLGEDVNREGIKKTPFRVAKALREGTRGIFISLLLVSSSSLRVLFSF